MVEEQYRVSAVGNASGWEVVPKRRHYDDHDLPSSCSAPVAALVVVVLAAIAAVIAEDVMQRTAILLGWNFCQIDAAGPFVPTS